MARGQDADLESGADLSGGFDNMKSESTTINNTEFADRNGYHLLASYMAEFPLTAVFRRFKMLNMLNLMSLQADLLELETQLKNQYQADKACGVDDDRWLFDRDWHMMSGAKGPDAQALARPQWDIMQKIRAKLKEYNEFLHMQHSVTKIPWPAETHVRELRKWMRRPASGGIHLTGVDKDVWKSTSMHEMVAMKNREYENYLTDLIADKAIYWFEHIIGRRFPKVYTSKQVARIVALTIMSLASLFPIMSIVVLNFVQDRSVKLGIITVFTVTFSFCMGLFSGAQQYQIFSASAAFAAVQVVFIAGS